MMRRHAISLLLSVFAAGVGTGYFLYTQFPLSLEFYDKSADQQVRLGNGVYTNPLLECEAADGTINASKEDFRNELVDYVNSLNAENQQIKIAVDYRDLNNGPAFGVNRDTSFSPASLLKVPVMMMYYRRAQRDPSILQERMTLTSDEDKALGDVTQYIPPEKNLIVGQSYSADELLERMIVYSDNQALGLLLQKISENEYLDLYKRLGVSTKVMDDPSYSLSAREYATFFRILYNASFISQEYSEKALGLLAKSTFSRGLRAGVPESIAIAHKFGERELQSGEKQLHDCGIIYYPEHPYLLCVMTRGDNLGDLEKIIKQISEFVYKKMDSQYGAET